MDASYSQIQFSVDGYVAVVALNNPPVNALGRQLYDELTQVMDAISAADDIRCVILTGNGKAFCAGADIKARAQIIQGPGDLRAHSRRTRETFHAVRECTKPVIAAVNGAALGAGLMLAASCDILIASVDAVLGLPEIDVGLVGGARHAMRLFGQSKVRRMVLTGDRISGEDLYRLGIVEQCTTREGLMPAARDLAARIASKSPIATRTAKHMLNMVEQMSLREGQRYEQDMTAAIANTEDTKEAQLAFKEKRPPIFKNR